jgi:hypothetical protein
MNPQPLLIGNPHFSNGQISFDVIGPAEQTVRVLVSSDLRNWTPAWTNVPGAGLFTFTNSQSGNYLQRFYRAASP